MSRLEPLPPGEWPAGMQDAMAALLPPNPKHPFPPRDPSRPKGLNILGLLAHHPDLATAYHHFNGHILFSTTITPRQRELLILRVAALRDAEYEWAQHELMAADVGIAADDVERIRVGDVTDGWAPIDAALLAAAGELVADARITDATYATLAGELDAQQLMDVVFTVGTYELLAMAMRTFDLELDEDLRRATGR